MGTWTEEEDMATSDDFSTRVHTLSCMVIVDCHPNPLPGSFWKYKLYVATICVINLWKFQESYYIEMLDNTNQANPV